MRCLKTRFAAQTLGTGWKLSGRKKDGSDRLYETAAEQAFRLGKPLENLIGTVQGWTTNLASLWERGMRIAEGASYRVPDFWNPFSRLLIEIKTGNVCNLQWQRQLATFAQWAYDNGSKMYIIVDDAIALEEDNPELYAKLMEYEVGVLEVGDALSKLLF